MIIDKESNTINLYNKRDRWQEKATSAFNPPTECQLT
jgi:hypothetical protein